MLGLQWPEIIVIAVVALILVGPNKLPHAAAQANQWIKDLRQMLESARADVVKSAGIDDSTLTSLADLHPKRIASSFLSGDTTAAAAGAAVVADSSEPVVQPRVMPQVSGGPRSPGGLDPDAT